MPEEIYLDDIECPHCERDTYVDAWDVKVDPYKAQVTTMVCDECGKTFYVRTELSVNVSKEL